MDFFQSPDFFTHQIKHLLGSIRHEDSKTWIFPRRNESGTGPSEMNFSSNIYIYIHIHKITPFFAARNSQPFLSRDPDFNDLQHCSSILRLEIHDRQNPKLWGWEMTPRVPHDPWGPKWPWHTLNFGGQKKHHLTRIFWSEPPIFFETPGQEMMVAHLYQLPEGWFLPNWINSVNSRGLQILQHPSDPSELHPLKKQANRKEWKKFNILKHDISTCHQPLSIQ